MKERKTLFRFMLDDLKKNQAPIKEEYNYIGTGNPLADILLIGKECSVSRQGNSKQYKEEIVDNFKMWCTVEDFDTGKINEHDFGNYNPLYPYKGQLLKKDNGSNLGTSVTWMNYQKLFNFIYNTPNHNEISFHEKAFITEVNSTPSRKTIEANTESIAYRKEHVLNSDFFDSFPIVILSGVGYFNKTGDMNEIEQLFKVRFTEKRYASENNRQPYWIHRNDDRTKILINTYQLSIGVGTNLLREIAEVIKKSGLLKV